MATTRTMPKADLIDRVAGLAQKKLGKAMAAEAEEFVRNFYDHVPPDDIANTDQFTLDVRDLKRASTHTGETAHTFSGSTTAMAPPK